MKVIRLLVLYIAILGSSALAQGNNYGLLFSGDSNKGLLRTEVDLTDGSPVSIKSYASISFDFSIWEPRSFGDLLRAGSPEGFKMALTYVQYLNKDTSYIALFINNQISPVKLPIAKKDLWRNKWFHLRMDMNLAKGNITLTFNNNSNTGYVNGLPKELLLNISIGNTRFVTGVPEMALKDFVIKDRQGILRYWKFNEPSGSMVYDYARGTSGRVKDGKWLLSSHINWEKTAEIYFEPGDQFGTAFDPAGQRILFTGKKYLYEFNITDNSVKKIFYQNRRPSTAGRSLYNPAAKKIFNFYEGRGEVSVYDEKTGLWTKIDTTKDFETEYYLNASFIDANSGSLYMFGGYGWYKCRNDLQKYDFGSKKWVKIPLKGDYIYPREFPSVSGPNENGNYYIFGGIGNKSGRQDMGFSEINDLFELNLKDNSAKRIWGLQGFMFKRLLLNEMIYSPEEKCLYGAAFDNNCVVENRYNPEKVILFRLNTLKPEIEVLNTSTSSEILYTVGSLFYNRKTQELFLISGLDNFKGRGIKAIYKILFPPLNKNKILSQWTEAAQKKGGGASLYFVYGGIMLLAITFFIYRERRKKKTPPENLSHVVAARMTQAEEACRIRLFGEFAVFEKDGNEITSHFKPKLRQLFLLILMNTYSLSYKSRGITSEKMSSYLWPELDTVQAKNNRNVSIARLRAILSKTPGLEIVYEDSLWSLKCSDDDLCDYFSFLKMKAELLRKGSISGTESENLLKLLARGTILNDVSYEWLDPLKASVEHEAAEILSGLLKAFPGEDEMLLKISEVMLLWDPVNEKALSSKMSALLKLGKENEARAEFKKFCNNYFDITGRNYTGNMPEALQ